MSVGIGDARDDRHSVVRVHVHQVDCNHRERGLTTVALASVPASYTGVCEGRNCARSVELD